MANLFPGIDLEEFLNNATLALDGAKLVGGIFSLQRGIAPNQQLELITKASVVKRVSALETVLALAKTGKALDGSLLLRPAIEENFWLCYLWSLDKADAEAVVNAKNVLDLCKIIDAQRRFYSAEQIKQLNVDGQSIDQIIGCRDWAKSTIEEVGSRLGWGKKGSFPSTERVAGFIGKKDQYDFLYRATSKVVHFCPHELYRVVWGNPKEVTLSVDHYAKYWALFSIYWGFKLWGELLEIVVARIELPDGIYDIDKRALDAFRWLGEFPPPPIVSAAELHWPVS